MNKIGLLFDLDGVIIDSEKEYSRIWQQINNIWPTGVPDFEREIKGSTLTSILNTYFPQDQHEKIKQKLYELEGKMIYYFAPGASKFLKDAKAKEFKTALVTSSDNIKMSHLITQMPDLLSYFDVVITANDISRSKPDPDGYLTAAKRLGIEAKNCIVFEDSLQGVAAGNNAGAFVVGISSTLGHEKIARNVGICINDLSEISIDDIKKLNL